MDLINTTLSLNKCRYSVIDSADSGLHWIRTYVLPCLIGVGLIGNSLTLISSNSTVNKQNPRLFLCAKAIADFLCGIFSILLNLNIYTSLIDDEKYDRFYYFYLQKPVFAIMNFLLMSSTWFAVAVTFERMFAVRWPLQARSVLTTRRIRLLIIIITAVSFFLTLYPLFVLTTVTHVDCKRPWKHVYANVGPLSKEQPILWHFGIVSRLVHNTVATIVSVLLLIMFNSYMVWHLRQHRRSMARFGHAGYSVQDASEQLRVCFVVSTVTAATTIFLLPSACVVLYDAVDKSVKSNSYRTIVHIANFLVLCDKTLYFFIYCMVSASFRDKLLLACRSCGMMRKLSARRQDLSMTPPPSYDLAMTMGSGTRNALLQQKCAN